MLALSPFLESNNNVDDQDCAVDSDTISIMPRFSRPRFLSDKSKTPWFFGLLVVAKFLAAAGVFLLYDFLRGDPNRVGVVHRSPATGVVFGTWSTQIQTLTVIQILSGVIYVGVQKPFSNWSKSKVSRRDWLRILRHAAVSTVFLLLWLSGLQYCGTFRTILIGSHYNFTLAGIVAGFFISKSGVKLRGGVLFATGILLLLLFDDNAPLPESAPPLVRPTKNPLGSGNADGELEQSFVSANSVGILILVICLVYKIGFEAFSKKLAVDVGGSKRLHALSTVVSGLLLFILFLVDLLSGSDMIPIWSNGLRLIMITAFGFVIDYYIDSICLKRLEPSKVARVGTSASMFGALLYSLLWTSEELPNTPTVLAFLLIYLGVLSLTSAEKASGGGSFVGYSSDGLPLFSFSSHFAADTYVPLWKNILRSTSSILKQIQEDAISRKLFYYSVLTLGFTGIEFLYGTITNSLGMITDGFHMLFDSMALCIGLSASVICRWKPSKTYPFGYGRIEVLSGFLNSFFLLVIASLIMVESLQRLYDPPEVNAHRLLPISIIGFIVNLIGIYTFRTSCGIRHEQSSNVNVKGVFLHILADTMGSLGVIISSFLIKSYGILVADPICSMIIAALIVVSVVPLLKETSKILLLSVPTGLEKNLQQSVLKILATEGVKGYRNARFWTHAPNVLTGSIHVQATEDANEQQVIRQVNQLFGALGFTHFTTQLEKDEFVARKSFASEYELGMDGGSGEEGSPGNRLLLENSSLEGFGPETIVGDGGSGGGEGLEQVQVVGESETRENTGASTYT